MKFSFLEGGIGWARSLFADLIGHWEKRNLEALANYNPANIDQELLAELSRRYGGKVIDGREYVKGRELMRVHEEDPTDDFASCAIGRKEDFRDLFLKPFFFGCEADDPVLRPPSMPSAILCRRVSTQSMVRISAILMFPI